MHLLVCVLDDPGNLQAVLDGWTEAGVAGATAVESTGLQRMRDHAGRADTPMFVGFSRLLSTSQYSHITLFALVSDMEIVEKAVAATEAVVGDLNLPHTGILFALPVTGSWGLPQQSPDVVAE